MKNYCIDFNGYCLITADDEKQAEDKFWEMVNSKTILPHANYEIEIDVTEEKY